MAANFINTSGNIIANSGNFTTLTINGTSIGNFNNSVSGLLPTIANSGDNRILTSTGSSVGINAEANLTFDGTNLKLNNQTANTIAGFDANKNIFSLPTSAYPSLTELSHVKGATSTIQTQLNNKANASHTHEYNEILLSGASDSAAMGLNASNFLYELDDDGLNEGISMLGGIFASSIVDFNSSVSDLLPTIANSGDNRILTSTGSTVGINAEANLTFDGSTLGIIGNVGAGTSSPTQRLQVHGSSGDDVYLRISNTDTTTASGLLIGLMGTEDAVIRVEPNKALTFGTNNTERMRIDNTGNVGIGVTSPQSKLSVVNGSDNTTTSLALKEAYIVGPNNTLASGAGNLQISTNDSASVDFGGMITFGGRYSTQGDARTIPWGVIKGAKENSTNGSSLGYLVFGTNDGSGFTITERMRINSSGNIGIGSSTNNANIRARLQIAASDADDDPSLGSGTGALLVTNSDSAYGMQFGVSADGVGWIQQGRVDGTATAYNLLLNPVGGNVGIGTSSPSTTLDIQRASSDAAIFVQGQTASTGATVQLYSGAGLGYIGTRNNYPVLFTTNNVERMRITSDGNFGIGTTTVSSGFKLDLRGRLLSYTTASDGLITVQGLQTESAGTGKAAIQIDVNGKGGFAWQNDASSGTRSLRLLENAGYGAGDTTVFSFIGGAFTFNRRVDITQGTTTGAQTHFYVRPENGALGRDSQITLGCTFSNGWGGADTAARDAGAIRFGANGGSADPRDWSMRFLVANGPGGSDTPRECMRITAAGNVEIGSFSEVSGSLKYLDIYNASATNNSGSIIRLVTRNKANTGNTSVDLVRYNNAAGDFYITNNDSGPTIFSNGGSIRFIIAADGKITAPETYNVTVGGTNRDLYIDSTGLIGYVSSIRSSKTQINNLDNVSWLKQLVPVSYYYRKKDSEGNYTDELDGTLDYGLIAEDVEVVAPELCFYDIVDDNPELRGIHYSKLITPMLKYIQELEQELQNIKNRVSALEGE